MKEIIDKFRYYCKCFYDYRGGIYPIASEKEIDEAINQYLNKINVSSFEGDTTDRERVREIIGK